MVEEVPKAEQILIDLKKPGRKVKDTKTITADLKEINSYFEKLKKTLTAKLEKEGLDKEEQNKLDLINSNVPIQTYYNALSEEEVENAFGSPMKNSNFNIILEDASLRADKMYFWLLDHVQDVHSPEEIIKTEDSIIFSETSQFGGQYSQIRGGKQQVAQQYLKTISEVMRGLFPLIYEIKQSDELIAMYEAANKYGELSLLVNKKENKNSEFNKKMESYFAAERVLRDKWASEVDGGKLFTFSKPQSQQGPGYVLLPHWFFSTKIRNPKDDESWPEVIKEKIDKMLEDKNVNNEIGNVLSNFFMRFKMWQNESFNQLLATREVKVAYLRQQYANIKLYIEWLKPMLKTIKYMTNRHGRSDAYKDRPDLDPNLLLGLDTTKMELQFIARFEAQGNYIPVIRITMNHQTSSLTFNIGGQNQNIPFGANDMKMDGFVWTKEQWELYQFKKEFDEFEILESLLGSMKDVRREIEKYLKEGIDTSYHDHLKERYPESYTSSTIDKLAKNKAKNKGFGGDIFQPFTELGKGLGAGLKPFGSLFTFKPGFFSSKDAQEEWDDTKHKQKALAIAKKKTWKVYDIFKKAHKCVTW